MSRRVGIIGTGQAGAHHARAILASRRASVAWVADPARARGEALAARCQARYVSDFNAALNDVDAVSICVPHAALAETAVAAAQAGVHLLLEKPMATTLADADRVIAAARRSGVTLMVGFVHRFRPEAARARELIAAGAIGPPALLTDHGFGGGQDAWPAWVQQARDGGGLLLYSGVHRFDRARWLLGREVISVCGSLAALLPGSDVDSSYGALLTMDGGARAVLSHHYHAIPVPHAWDTEAHGGDGLIRIHAGEGLEVITREGTRHVAAGPDRRFEEQFEAFLDAIDGAREPAPSGADGRAALAVALAIARSHATGAVVSLPAAHQ
jgi:predicted dehydrogenase